MRYFKYINLLLLLLIINTAKAENITNNGSTKSFQMQKGGKVEFDLIQGNITVDTWNKDEVLIRIESEDEEYGNPLKYKQSGSWLYVTPNYEDGWASYDLRVTVPKQINLSIKANFGDIKLRDEITGNVYLKTSGGEVHFANIKGDLNAFSAGGDIRGMDVTGKLDLKTMGGEIYLGTLSGEIVRIETMGGDIRIKKSIKGLNLHTYGGDIKVGDIGDDSELTTNGGDINTGFMNGNGKLKTMGGDITLNGAKGKITVESGAGDLKLYGIVGSIDANTMAGEVNVELTPTGGWNSVIKSSSGDINLYLPSNAKAYVDAKIRDWGWYDEDEPQIDSDFEPTSLKKSNKSGNITASYSINGGGDKIYLETTNSKISVKKNKK